MVKIRLKQNEDNDDEKYSIEMRGDEGKDDKTKMVKIIMKSIVYR